MAHTGKIWCNNIKSTNVYRREGKSKGFNDFFFELYKAGESLTNLKGKEVFNTEAFEKNSCKQLNSFTLLNLRETQHFKRPFQR